MATHKAVFGDFIKQKREEKELSRLDLALQIGVSESAISAWEGGRYLPSRNMETLANALGVEVEELAVMATGYHKPNGKAAKAPPSSNGHETITEVVITPPITLKAKPNGRGGGIMRAKIAILENTAVIRGMLQVARLVGDERTVEVTKMVEEKIVSIEEEARGLDE